MCFFLANWWGKDSKDTLVHAGSFGFFSAILLWEWPVSMVLGEVYLVALPGVPAKKAEAARITNA